MSASEIDFLSLTRFSLINFKDDEIFRGEIMSTSEIKEDTAVGPMKVSKVSLFSKTYVFKESIIVCSPFKLCLTFGNFPETRRCKISKSVASLTKNFLLSSSLTVSAKVSLAIARKVNDSITFCISTPPLIIYLLQISSLTKKHLYLCQKKLLYI